jgi:hypothetical protein
LYGSLEVGVDVDKDVDNQYIAISAIEMIGTVQIVQVQIIHLASERDSVKLQT